MPLWEKMHGRVRAPVRAHVYQNSRARVPRVLYWGASSSTMVCPRWRHGGAGGESRQDPEHATRCVDYPQIEGSCFAIVHLRWVSFLLRSDSDLRRPTLSHIIHVVEAP